MRLRAIVLLLLLSASVLAACEPTGVPRCDRHGAQLVEAGRLGFRYDCTPPTPGFRPGTQIPVAGWADINNGIAYIWPNHITGTSRSFAKIMWHELGHLRHHQLGGSGRDERWADAYSWCKAPYPELSYHVRPSAAECSRRFLR